MRTCRLCDETKPLYEFYKRTEYEHSRGHKATHRTECKACVTQRNRARLAKLSPQERAARKRDERKRLKREVFFVLGDQCAYCHNPDPRVLQIDHVNGGGSAHRRNTAEGTYLRQIRDNPSGFQLLCANCHMIKTAEELCWQNQAARRVPGISMDQQLGLTGG